MEIMGIKTNPKGNQLVRQGNSNKITWTDLSYAISDL